MTPARLLWLTLNFILLTRTEATDFPCTVVTEENDGGKFVYDLSELADRDHWKHTETLHIGAHLRHEFYLSLCHPLRNAPSSCAGNNTGVCAIIVADAENTIVVQAGQVSQTGPVVSQWGQVEYRFEHGESCSEYGRQMEHVTNLYIMCAAEKDETGGPILMSSPGCQMNFAWMSKAACPRKLNQEASINQACRVNFPNSEHILNLHALQVENHYSVKISDTAKYELNICGPVLGGACDEEDATVCKVEDGHAPVVYGTTRNMKLEWQEYETGKQGLWLEYQHQNYTVKILLVCERQQAEPLVHAVKDFGENDTVLVFNLVSSAICQPRDPLCVEYDYLGNVIDLRPLYKEAENWEVLATVDQTQVLFQINMCGQINNNQYFHCPLGPIGACQAGVSQGGGYNLGFLTSDPVINSDETVTVLYTGGDECGRGNYTRSTRINLVCNSEEHRPVFIEETQTCEYVFKWLTPAACPRHTTTGTNCQVSDPLYGNDFDLRPLREDNRDYNVNVLGFDNKTRYLVNICGPLVSHCNEAANSSICKVEGEEMYSAGLQTSNLTFKDGVIVMNFNNGTGGCKDNHARSTQIHFSCDHNSSGRDGPVFLYEDDKCTSNFFWATQYACPPYRVVDCSYTAEDGTMYDLNEISLPNSNQEYYTADGTKKFVLNVCRSVVHTRQSRCSNEAGACIIDLTHQAHPLNIGQVQNGPYLDKEGNLVLKYVQGEPCEENSAKPSETIINFVCDRDELYPYPQFITANNCSYVFEWKTPAACPISPKNITSIFSTGENCSVTSTFTGYKFDLSSLQKKTGYEVQNGDHRLVLNVCAAVKNEHCDVNGAGACTYSTSSTSAAAKLSAGLANDALQFYPGFLSLVYSGGSPCRNGVSRSTVISFICGAENAAEGPELIEDNLDSCVYFLNWNTEKACERRISCFVDADWRIDLSPLIRSTGNYEVINANNTKEKFYINVCRPLNPMMGLNCPPGSASCLSTPQQSAPLSLGHPLTTPVYDNEDGVIMLYSHGSKCPFNHKYDVATKIYFVCVKSAGKGAPVLTSITDDCVYVFHWKTSIVCKESKPQNEGPVCQIKYDAAKTNVNLQPLYRPDGYTVHHGGMDYWVNVCGAVCNGSGVCSADGHSFGSVSNSVLKWDFDRLKLTYYGGDECTGTLTGYKTSFIYFQCNMTAGYGHPEPHHMMDTLDCHAIFQWDTNVTCMEALYDNGDADSHTQAPETSTAQPQEKKEAEESHSSVSAIIAGVMVVAGIVFVAVLVLFKSQRGQRVTAAARRLFRFKGHTTLLLDDVC